MKERPLDLRLLVETEKHGGYFQRISSPTGWVTRNCDLTGSSDLILGKQDGSAKGQPEWVSAVQSNVLALSLNLPPLEQIQFDATYP